MTAYTWLSLGSGIGLLACGWMLTAMSGRDTDDNEANGPIEAGILSSIGITLIAAAPFIGWLA